MIRTARVLNVDNASVTFELIKTPNCAGCPINCNRPLIDVFGLKKRQFTLSFDDPQYALVDPQDTLTQSNLVGQQIQLEINTHDVMQSSAWLYMWPLFMAMMGLVIGYGLGMIWGIGDWFAVIMMLLFLSLNQAVKTVFLTPKVLKFRPQVTILSLVGTQTVYDGQ